MKYLKYILSSVILITMVSCDAFSDPDLPIPLDETMDNTGAFLRMVEVQTAGFDILEIQDAAFVFYGEYWDDEGQSLLDNVEFYSNFQASSDGDLANVGRTLIKTYPFSEFGTNEETGWPAQTFSIAITEINAVLGIDEADNLLGDRYQVDWVLNLTDGRSFTSNEMSPAITGGFFSSPNNFNVDVVARIPAEDFVGNYEFTQQEIAPSGTTIRDFESGWMYNAAQVNTFDVGIDPNNDLNGRIFTATPFALYGVASRDYPFTVALANDTAENSVTLSTNVSSGLGCSAIGIFYGTSGSANNGHFELDDDSSFEFATRENSQGDCGRDPVDILFDAVKL